METGEAGKKENGEHNPLLGLRPSGLIITWNRNLPGLPACSPLSVQEIILVRDPEVSPDFTQQPSLEHSQQAVERILFAVCTH